MIGSDAFANQFATHGTVLAGSTLWFSPRDDSYDVSGNWKTNQFSWVSLIFGVERFGGKTCTLPVMLERSFGNNGKP